MILFNTTYTDREEQLEIETLVGKPFSLVEKIKLGGIGSKRLIIHGVSTNLQMLLNKVSDVNYANIELRPKGIIVHITKQLKRYSWVIPYYKLSIFNITYFSIHSEGNFIQMVKNNRYEISKKFISKMMHLKSISYEKFRFI